ncbi:MAG: hypothetical protein IMW89_02665 [Ktedonobacteraceae bacterium]|nr:hypothetical protein [Ktedonobacteraceae bacterium]
MKVRLNLFHLMAGVYLLLDALALAAHLLALMGVIPFLPGLNWLRIHLLTIGVVVQMIVGTLPLLVRGPQSLKWPEESMTRVLWLLLNGSFVLLLYSMPAGLSILAAIAGTGIFVVIVLLLVTLFAPFQQKKRVTVEASLSRRFYLAGPFFFLVGILMALSMLLNWPAPGQFFGLLEAHVHANVWGFLALVVAGFLLEHLPAFAGQPLRWPALVPATFWLLIVGATGLVAGPWLAMLPLTIVGIALYVVGTTLLLTNLGGTLLRARSWLPNLAHLVLAYLWMVVPAFVAPLTLMITGHLPTGRIESAAVSGLVAGWILQIVIGAFPLRLREEKQIARGRDGWWISVGMLNIGVLALWILPFLPETASSFAEPVTILGYTLIILSWLPPLLTVLSRVLSRRSVSLQE